MMYLICLLAVVVGFTCAQEAVFQQPTSDKAVFVETFGQDWAQRWQVTTAEDFEGEWKVAESSLDWKLEGDTGLIVSSVARKHGISTKFDKVLQVTDKPLVVQYEVRLQKQLGCGGAYLKLVRAREEEEFDPLSFGASTDYVIMFGPDKCGSMNKVHFIFKHRNPVTGEFEEKHMVNKVSAKLDQNTHLYTLLINADNSFEIYIDLELETSGTLLSSFEPPVNPPATIDDPEDVKPVDWVDEDMIEDSSAEKPEDWDEDAPEYVLDEEAEKPEEWLEEEPLMIEDPEAVKPEDWDDENDGEWEAPMVENPLCESGCGPWEPPMIPNPAYKGVWTPPMVPNPSYKGEWSPRQIENPAYFEDEHPHNLSPIAGLGFELWTMTDEIMFDNVFVGHNLEDALEFASESWSVKREAEENAREALNAAAEEEEEAVDDGEGMDMKRKIQEFIVVAKQNPLALAGAILIGFVGVYALLSGKKETVKDKRVPASEEESVSADQDAAQQEE